MPTRIVLNEKVASRQYTRRSLTDIESAPTSRTSESPTRLKSSRKIVRLKSSLIRGKKDSDFRALSSEDIRASPRLLGYCFQLLASIVMLISVTAFYRKDNGDDNTPLELWSLFNRTRVEDNNIFYSQEGGAVFIWKLIGCFVVSAFGTIFTLGIIVVHFDTVCFPSFWLLSFRDGSRHEQFLLISLAIFWAIGLHINTSFDSVGNSQANVFFTSWISFFSSILNYGIWRVSAGRTSIAVLVNEHHRETTYNWLWVLFCSLIFAGSIADIYLSREYLELYFKGEQFIPDKSVWIKVMCITWGLVLVSFVSIILNHFLRKSCELRVFRGSFVLLGWRQAEGLVALSVTGIMFWIVFRYTGYVDIFL